MTQNIKNDGNLAKGVLVGAAALAGVATVMALSDDKNRKEVRKSLTDMQNKGMDMKKKAKKMAKKQLEQ